jgi:AbrB family looped-hinge helix DNA binding protein
MGHKVTSKGQVTLPKAMRDDLGINPGDEVDFIKENGTYRVRKHFDRAKFDAAIQKWAGTVDLGGMTVDEYIEETRGR